MMGPTSVGYKSSQCNTLYYDPRPDLSAAEVIRRHACSRCRRSARPATPASAATTRSPTSASPTSTRSSSPTTRPRSRSRRPFPTRPRPRTTTSTPAPRDAELRAPLPARRSTPARPTLTPGGGTWTKVNVTAPVGRRASRTSRSGTRTTGPGSRLIKSAASLAFSPLNDTKRIGFITMQPKSSAGAAGINPLRFLPVGRLQPGLGGQKDQWFSKLFEQIPGGASPAREGLARVGRYYGGKEDSINTDMPATGANDPIQYACQQNFTIMTTDGYWNGQTESRGSGLFGGGLQLDGVTKVGQQDGDPQRPVLAAADLGRHLQLHPRRHRQDQRLHRQRLQPGGHVPLDVPAPARSVDDDQGLDADDEARRSSTSRRRARSTRTTDPDDSPPAPTDMRSRRSSSPCTGSTTSRRSTSTSSREEQTTKVTEQWELQTTPGRGADLPDAQGRHPGLEDRRSSGTTAKSQSVQTTTQYVMQKRPVQARPQAGLPAPVPDARQDRRRRDRRSAVGRLHADPVGGPLRGPGCPPRRARAASSIRTPARPALA